MKRHRIRTATSIVPGDPRRHLFVEIKQDTFIECDPAGLPILDDAGIHTVRKEVLNPKHGVISFSARSFRIGLIKDWREEAVVIA